MKKMNLLKSLLAVPALAISLTVMPQQAAIAQSKDADKAYTYAEQMPSFEGGESAMMKFLGENISYPADAREAGIQGMVVASFVVETDGKVSDVKIMKSLSKSIDAEASRVIKLTSGKWTAGKQNGKAVRVRFTMPVRFSLDGQGNTTPTTPENGAKATLKDGPLEKFLARNMRYPKASNFEGDVQVQLTIDESGKVVTMIPTDTDPAIAQEINRVLQLTQGNWKNATQNDKPVAYSRALIIRFVTDGSGNPSASGKADVVVTRYK
jgi:TonB family protein